MATTGNDLFAMKMWHKDGSFMSVDDDFDIYARGSQSWEHVKVTVDDGPRIRLEIDGTLVRLTAIQSTELLYWLVRMTSD